LLKDSCGFTFFSPKIGGFQLDHFPAGSILFMKSIGMIALHFV